MDKISSFIEKATGSGDDRQDNQQSSHGGNQQSSYGGNQQPSYGGNQQSYGGGQQPYGGNQQPSFGGSQQSYGGGNQQPYGGNQQSYGGGQQSYGGNQQPPYGDNQQSSYGGNQQSYGGNQQSSYGGGQQSSYGGGNQHSSSTGTPYGGGGPGASNDFSGANSYAQSQSEGSGDSSLFSSALSFLSGRGKDEAEKEDLDEDDMVRQHKAYYEQGDKGGKSSADGVGKAAAMQAMKLFNSKSSKETEGGSQNALIGMAMGQAAKLFDQQAQKGNVPEGESKETAIQSAAKMAFKMYLKSQMSGGSGGGSGGLMGMASKFF